jgi:RAB protein geranylgeranyltransferase component A
MTDSVPPTPEDDAYDLVIEGTGLTESILAAAAARAGKKVIHIDKNAFYGSHWAALSITDLDQWVQQHSSDGTQSCFDEVNGKIDSHIARQH